MAELGNFIKEKRDALGKTMREMAKALDLSTAYISDIEKGNRKPSDAVLDKIADFLQLENTERSNLYDLAAEEKGGTAPHDVSSYITQNKPALVALRKAQSMGATKKDWENFVSQLEQNRKGADNGK